MELSVVPTRALRLALEAEFRRRVTVEDGHELLGRREIGNPSGVDGDEPEISIRIEGPAFEKLSLRGVMDVGEQFDRPDPRWRRWQSPRLDSFGRQRARWRGRRLSPGGASPEKHPQKP